ncbi:MAG: methyltransferase domain-containing protein [Elusimicrobia bacterium]|nr:methyltransferase domain-containing protein [Elusimicrobiota bacterium]
MSEIHRLWSEALKRGAKPGTDVDAEEHHLHGWVDVLDSWGTGKPYSGMACIDQKWLDAHPVLWSSAMKIEIGGGRTPRGEGFVNVDILPCADVVIDLELGRLPFPSDSVDAAYTSHCLEHVNNAVGVLGELLRVCKIGAPVEIRVPHWLHPMACCSGHVHVLSDRQVEIWCNQPENFWPESPKRFALKGIHYQIDVAHHELRPLFPALTDEQVAKYIPGCCHEIRCSLEVVAR